MGCDFVEVAQQHGAEELRLAGNGLRVLLVPDDSVPVVAACIVYLVGSRNEAVGHTGATHLLEHLMFKGSRGFNPATGRSVARTLERVGAAFNATTWFDRTNYYETLPPEHLSLALELEADRMRHALLRGEDLAAEMTVVRNEFERGENDPFDVLLKESFAIAFREHPYHHPTIGWRSDIEHMTIERLRSFYDTFYYPDNAMLVLVGAFQRDEALELVARHFEGIPAAPRPIPPVVTVEPPQQGERRFIVRRAGEVGWVVVSHRAPAAGSTDSHALAIAADALSGGVTSRLYQRLVETGKCLDVQAIAWQLKDPGLFQVLATLNGSDGHSEVEAEIRRALVECADAQLDPAELDRAKAQVETQTAFHRDSPGQVASALTEAVAAVDWRSYFDYPARIAAVQAADVQRACQAVFVDDAISVGWFVPRDGGHAGTQVPAPHPQHVKPRPCGYLPTLAERVVEVALPGGARAVLLPRHVNPTVHLQGSLLAGHGLIGQDQWSAASLLPDMLERGAGARDRLGIARDLEDRGIELAVSGESFNPLEVFLTGRCLARHLDLMVEILLDQLRRPTLPDDELKRLRQLRLGELAHSQDDTFLRAFEGFSRLVYPAGHPFYRRSFDERKRGLDGVTRADLLRVHEALYTPPTLVLAVVGDFDPDEAAKLLEQAVSGWAAGPGPIVDVPRRRPADAEPRSVRIGLDDKPNVDVVLGHPGGLRRRDDDYLAAALGNSVLGQSTLSSRLGQRLRDKEGLTYGVISRFFGASLIDGPWATSFSVAAADLDRAVAIVREEISRLVVDGPGDDELADEKAALAGSYRVSLAGPGGQARELARLARHSLPWAELDELPARILALAADDVRAALRVHLNPDHLAWAAAGSFVAKPEGGE